MFFEFYHIFGSGVAEVKEKIRMERGVWPVRLGEGGGGRV